MASSCCGELLGCNTKGTKSQIEEHMKNCMAFKVCQYLEAQHLRIAKLEEKIEQQEKTIAQLNKGKPLQTFKKLQTKHPRDKFSQSKVRSTKKRTFFFHFPHF